MNVTFDQNGFKFDGQDAFMVSGEFHYFRVPCDDWKRRMELFKAAGGNMIAIYVPWIIHEPNEGEILFGDRPERDLAAFLDTAREVGLAVCLRPGPYQYSELINDGLPEWLLRDYPEVRAADVTGKPFRHCSVSYLHPTFLKKARTYFKAFAEVVRPYMNDPVTMLQVDNETTGVHVWFGGVDYNPETMGFGKADGRYPRYLARTYATVAELNSAYGTDFASFTEVCAPAGLSRANAAHCRRLRDYYNFYYETIAEYLTLLRDWLREDGLCVPVCHNAGGPHMVQFFKKTVESMDDDFLLGVDHYYTLGQTWQQNNPTPQHAVRAFCSLERLRLLSQPQTVLEMPGGSPTDTPPILPEDLLAWYRTNVAFGMKGVNYYIYTGGPNFPDTGSTCDIYDYNALVHADGSINPTYYSAKDIGLFMKDHGWLQKAVRRASVNVGFEWEQTYSKDFDPTTCAVGAMSVRSFTETGVLHTLLCGKYAPALCALDGELDFTKPLIVPAGSCLSEAAQTKLVDFVKAGGKLIMFGALPEYNEKFESCTVLRDFIGDVKTGGRYNTDTPIRMANGKNIYKMQRVQTLDELPVGTECMATDTFTGKPIGFKKECGGTLMWFGLQWHMGLFVHAEMMEDLLEMCGAVPAVKSSNRSLFTSLLEADGKRMLFIMNLFSGAQSTEITVYNGGAAEEPIEFKLSAMEVLICEI